MAVIIGSARSDENGKAINGKAGDQTGKEISTQNWYLSSKGWRVFRCIDSNKAKLIAVAMKNACSNNNIGYDQAQRNTLYTVAENVGFDTSKVTTKCETDCSALVRVCCAYAGIMLSNFYTSTEASILMTSGMFIELKDTKYTRGSTYLMAGDILCTKTKGHTVVVLTDGKNAEPYLTQNVGKIELGDRELRNGCIGNDVKELQENLVALGYDIGDFGADGDFGDCTEAAVIQFQKNNELIPDGIYGKNSHVKMIELIEKEEAIEDKPETEIFKFVQIVGGNCYVRTSWNKTATLIGIAYKGKTYQYLGDETDGWFHIKYKDTDGWISGKYGKLINNK